MSIVNRTRSMSTERLGNLTGVNWPGSRTRTALRVAERGYVVSDRYHAIMPDRDRPPPQLDTEGQPTPWAIWSRLNDIDYDVRSVKQTVEKEIVPRLDDHESDLKILKNRWLYALTMIASAAGAVVYLALNGPFR